MTINSLKEVTNRARKDIQITVVKYNNKEKWMDMFQLFCLWMKDFVFMSINYMRATVDV